MPVKKIALICLTAVALASCSTPKTTLPYFQDISTIESGKLPTLDYLPLIQPDDELFITVTSTQPEATVIYNNPSVNPAKREVLLENSVVRNQTYVVDSRGDIDFPVLGNIHVAGLTTEQLRADLTRRISKDVIDPRVQVEIVNFKVMVAGEVKQPMAVKITGNRMTILDALAEAGDMTEYGDRSNVLIIREQDGQRIYKHLDLTSSEVLSSPYYYLKQNDYIYVAPNNIREANSKYNQFNAYKLSLVSTIVSAASVIASLVIALTVK